MIKSQISDFRFILDVHLGKLAKLLRLFGFDTICNPDFDDMDIIRFSVSDSRMILTRDKELLMNSRIAEGLRILSQDPDEQLREVFRGLALKGHINPFIRCMECNTLVEKVMKEDIADKVLPATLKFYFEFKKCPGCGNIYWEGSHYERMKKYIDSVIKDVN
jgi:uncharacterized protein